MHSAFHAIIMIQKNRVVLDHKLMDIQKNFSQKISFWQKFKELQTKKVWWSDAYNAEFR